MGCGCGAEGGCTTVGCDFRAEGGGGGGGTAGGAPVVQGAWCFHGLTVGNGQVFPQAVSGLPSKALSWLAMDEHAATAFAGVTVTVGPTANVTTNCSEQVSNRRARPGMLPNRRAACVIQCAELIVTRFIGCARSFANVVRKVLVNSAFAVALPTAPAQELKGIVMVPAIIMGIGHRRALVMVS